MKNQSDNSGDQNEAARDLRADAPLWELLGRANRPQPSPYFARRVLREVSLWEEARDAERWWQPAVLWRACRQVPRAAFLAGTPIAALVLVFVGLRLNPSGSPVSPGKSSVVAAGVSSGANEPKDVSAVQTVSAAQLTDSAEVPAASPAGSVAASAALPDEVSAQDVDVIADLDTALKREQNRLWTEDTARF